MLLVAGGVLYVASRAVHETCDFLVGEFAHDLAGCAHNQRAGWVDLAFRNQRARANQAVFADHGMVQNGGADTDQATLADAAAVQHDFVADRDVSCQDEWRAWVGMEDAAVLNVAAWADHNGLIVATKYGIPPHRTVFGAFDAANQDGIRRHPGCRVDLRDPVFQLIAAHGRAVSSKMGGAAFYAVTRVT